LIAATSSSPSVPAAALSLSKGTQRIQPGLGQFLTGVEQLALRVQHIDVDAHADFVAQLVRIHRRLRGGDRRLVGLDLGQAGTDAKIGLARVQCRGAARIVEVGGRLFLQGHGFAILGNGRAAREQGNRQLHADGVALAVGATAGG
jgi:hypothetical protein